MTVEYDPWPTPSSRVTCAKPGLEGKVLVYSEHSRCSRERRFSRRVFGTSRVLRTLRCIIDWQISNPRNWLHAKSDDADLANFTSEPNSSWSGPSIGDADGRCDLV